MSLEVETINESPDDKKTFNQRASISPKSKQNKPFTLVPKTLII